MNRVPLTRSCASRDLKTRGGYDPSSKQRSAVLTTLRVHPGWGPWEHGSVGSAVASGGNSRSE